jgi:hypothetical protein
MTYTLRQRRGEDPGLQRMGVLLQQAVLSRSSCRQYNWPNPPRKMEGGYMSDWSEINE